MRDLRVSLLKMNRRQTRAFIAGIAVFLFMGFYPPWVHEYRNELGGRRTVSAGYGFLTSPPSAAATYNLHDTHVDLPLLLVGWLVAAGITFGAIVYFADRNADAQRLLRRYER
jgi:hypothetical protein